MANPVEGILRFTAARPSIGDLILNCTVREVHGGEFEVAKSPIEDGSVLSDHRIELPRVLEMEAIISPYPDNLVDQVRSQVQFAASAIKTGSSEDYYRTSWARVRALASSNETFQVITDREIYPNMTFESYSHVEQNKGIIHLNAILVQIEFATVLREKFLAENFADVGGSSADVGLQGLALL
jgi:hypothetical protein